jgi:hypothetical protein
VLGAAGAGRMPFVVELAPAALLAAGGRLVIVPDADDSGEAAAIRAGRAAIVAGLELERDLVVADLRGHPDLNAAWQAGWRP